MKRYLSLLILLLIFELVKAGTDPFVSNKDVFGLRVFIENKGQFDKETINYEGIQFAYDNGAEKIYFTKKGLIYKMIKWPKLDHEEWEEIEKGEKEAKPESIYYIHMNWEGCNQNIQIEKSEVQDCYFTYGHARYNSYGFKKIVYKNVYNHIDIEYLLPEDKEHGIKYNVILHPGADPKNIRIVYSGDVNSCTLVNGNITIETPMLPIKEYAPKTYYGNGTELKTEFLLNRNNIGFSFIDGYDNTQEVIIDPFVTTISTLPGNNYGYDVDYDNAGNVYVYGGHSPHKVAKYNSLGVHQWTFPGTISSPAWSWGWLTEGFTLNRSTGKVYLGGVQTSAVSRVIRLDNLGNYDNFISNGGTLGEIWQLGFNPANGDLIPFGGNGPLNLGTINENTGFYNITFNTTGKLYDIACHTFDDAGNCFLIQTSGQSSSTFPNPLNNNLVRINSSITDTLWRKPSTYSSFSEASNKNNFVGVGYGLVLFTSTVTSNEFNCLAVNGCYLYYYDGYNLAAYNKNTGVKIGSTTISGHIVLQQAGIAVDACNNVYVGGSNGSVLAYNFNGTSFTALSPININATSSLKYVYDIKLNRQTNTLYVTGSGFLSSLSAIHSLSCSANNAACLSTPPPSFQSICFGSAATVSISNVNNLSNPSYSIQPSGQIQSTPFFTVNPTSITVYTLYLTGTMNSAIITQSAIATVSINPTPILSPSVTNATCNNPAANFVNLNITFTPNIATNYTVNWSPLPSTITSVNSGTAAGLTPGINNVTVATANGCSITTSFSVPPLPLPANFIIANPSNDYTVTCSNLNVLLTTSITNGIPLTYTWFPSCTNTVIGSSINFTQNCTGQVIGTSSTGCSHTETFTIYQDYTSPTVAVTPTLASISCTSPPTTFTGTSNLGPNVTTNWFQIIGSNTVYVGASGGTVNVFQAGQPGIFWFESVYNLTGCKATMSVQVSSSVGVPIFTVTSPNNFTVGCSIKNISTMQVSTVVTSPTLNVPCNYAFVPPPGTLIPNYSSNPNIVTTNTPGTWVIYVKDQTNNCISSQSITILQNTVQPNVEFIQPLSILNCRELSMVLSGISSNTNTTITWTVPSLPSSSVFPAANVTVSILPSAPNATNNLTTIGIYTIGAVDNNNLCRSTKTVQINQDLRLPRFTLSAASQSVLNCKNNDVLIFPVSSGSLAMALVPTYVWIPPVGFSLSGSSYNTSASGNHTAIATSVVNGCTYSATYNVAADFNPPVLASLGEPFILDCNINPMATITPSVVGPLTGLTYSWSAPPGAITSNINALVLTTNKVGSYLISITNTINGCTSQGIYEVIEGGIKADFIADPIFGFAPLVVTFTNTSATTTGSSNIVSTWGYGNGVITQTVLNNVLTNATYTAPGTYSVILTVQKGTCIDSEIKLITVELPSKIEVPNVFTPNGDGSNDIFKLRASSLEEIGITIFDRWGAVVYELISDTGNFAWDGKNQFGKDCASGTYFYILKAKGRDGEEYELKGNVSLYR